MCLIMYANGGNMNVEYLHDNFVIKVQFEQHKDTSRYAIQKAMMLITEQLVKDAEEEADYEVSAE